MTTRDDFISERLDQIHATTERLATHTLEMHGNLTAHMASQERWNESMERRVGDLEEWTETSVVKQLESLRVRADRWPSWARGIAASLAVALIVSLTSYFTVRLAAAPASASQR